MGSKSKIGGAKGTYAGSEPNTYQFVIFANHTWVSTSRTADQIAIRELRHLECRRDGRGAQLRDELAGTAESGRDPCGPDSA